MIDREEQAKHRSGPRVCLAFDNCFASKRFARPEERIGPIGSLGASIAESFLRVEKR